MIIGPEKNYPPLIEIVLCSRNVNNVGGSLPLAFVTTCRPHLRFSSCLSVGQGAFQISLESQLGDTLVPVPAIIDYTCNNTMLATSTIAAHNLLL
jgi:hypothetical protein